MNAAASESTCVYRLLCARMVPAGEFVVGTGCIGAAKERRNDDEVCERTSSPATLRPGAKGKLPTRFRVLQMAKKFYDKIKY